MTTQIENKVKIGIVDDQPIFCDGLKSYLLHYDNIEVVVMATSGKEILSKLSNNTNLPDILLLDIDMPEMDGLELLKIVKDSHPIIKVIMLSMHSELVYVENAIQLGASGYVRKGGVSEDIFKAIEMVSKFNFFLDDVVLKELEEKRKHETKNNSVSNLALTIREMEVLRLICKEKTTKQIADILDASVKSVEYNRACLFKKTDSISVVGLVYYAIKNNLDWYII